MNPTRRDFLHSSLATGLALAGSPLLAQLPGDRPKQATNVEILNPQGKVPISFIIDDSTTLLNLNKFAVPQFAAVPGFAPRYQQPWRDWPDTIPNSFVRKFGEWSAEQGIKGKYSIVPYPACVGRLDRLLPGWSAQELRESLKLVRELMLPNWDIHPEMVTHTRVIDLKTGHPYPETTQQFMENWLWTKGKSVDELASYFAYALKILKNVELPCTGITTPGGFGNPVMAILGKATEQACRDLFQVEIPHYFTDLFDRGNESVAPRVENASGLTGNDPRCVVQILGCTGDWTGGWDCGTKPDVDKFITKDLHAGRLVEVIDRGEPAVLVCHWTGIYFNGQELGFKAFQEVVRRLNEKYKQLIWMKLSEIARYWAAKELTTITAIDNGLSLHAPFACPSFTVRVKANARPIYQVGSNHPAIISSRDGDSWVISIDLAKGKSKIILP